MSVTGLGDGSYVACPMTLEQMEFGEGTGIDIQMNVLMRIYYVIWGDAMQQKSHRRHKD